MGRLNWTIAGKTDRGKVRENNEDNILINESLGLIAVADGLGGHQGGEVASRMATELVAENYRRLALANALPEKNEAKLALATKQLISCVRLANQAIFEASKNYPQDQGMGTTITALLLHDDYISLAHVGDTRAYILRNGRFEQITKDHSLVMEQVRKGLISKEQADVSKMQHILARALGTEAKVEIDAEEHPVFAGDLILLCSDGLNKMTTDQEVLAVINATKNPPAICDTLIEAANAAGGRDNISVIAARAEKAGFLSSLKSKFQGSKNSP